MPTFEEMVEGFGAPPVAAPGETAEQRVWRRIKGKWLPFHPPPLPRTGSSLEWVWRFVLDDDPAPPTTEQLRGEAALEDEKFPECHNALYRRSHPDWLEEKLSCYTEYHSERRWRRIEDYLDGAGGLPAERLAWLRAHEEAVRPVIEEAKAEHFRRYSVGTFWLRPDADGEVPAWKRARWPAPRNRFKVSLAYCTRWTRPEDRASQLRDCER
jgi:hypothetical protein